MIFKVVNKQLRRDDELRLNFRRDISSLFVSKSMARQIPSKSKHRIMAEKPARRSRSSTTRTTTTSSTRSSNTRSTNTSSTRTSTTPIVSHGVQARGRLEHQEDNSVVESLPRVLDGLGSLQGSIETSLESTSLESTVSTPLVPAVIPTPRRTSTPTVSRVLEPLYSFTAFQPRLKLPTIVGAKLWSSCRRFSLDKGILTEDWRNGSRDTCRAKGGKTDQRRKRRGFRRRFQ